MEDGYMIDYKIIIGDASVCEERLKKWGRTHNLDVCGFTVSEYGVLYIIVKREKKNGRNR